MDAIPPSPFLDPLSMAILQWSNPSAAQEHKTLAEQPPGYPEQVITDVLSKIPLIAQYGGMTLNDILPVPSEPTPPRAPLLQMPSLLPNPREAQIPAPPMASAQPSQKRFPIRERAIARLNRLQPYAPPEIGQLPYEMGGSIVGQFAGKPLGLPGEMGGAFLGSMAGSMLAGRTVGDALTDATMAAMMGGAMRTVESGVRAIPGVSSTMSRTGMRAAQSTDELAQSLYDTITHGAAIGGVDSADILRSTLRGHHQFVRFLADQEYLPLHRSQPVNLGRVLQMANDEGIRLPRYGVNMQMTAAGMPYTSFNDAQSLLSQVGEIVRDLDPKRGGQGNALLHRFFTHVQDELRTTMEDSARSGGFLPQWEHAQQFYRKEVIERFQEKVIRDIMGGRTLAQLQSGVGPREGMALDRVMPAVMGMNLDEATTLMNALTPHAKTPVAMRDEILQAQEVMRSRLVGELLSTSTITRTDGRTILQPSRLAALLDNESKARLWEPEVKDLLLGPQTAKTLQEFAQVLARRKAKGQLEFVLGGMGTVAVTGFPLAGQQATATGIRAVETANEWNLLGNMFLNRPSVMKTMTQAVLTGNDAVLRKQGLAGLVRVAVPQVAGQTFIPGLMPQLPSSMKEYGQSLLEPFITDQPNGP